MDNQISFNTTKSEHDIPPLNINFDVFLANRKPSDEENYVVDSKIEQVYIGCRYISYTYRSL
jgi:hypothetical protein